MAPCSSYVRDAMQVSLLGEVKGDMQAFCGTDIKEWYSRTATSQSVEWVADLVATFKSSFPKV